MDESRHGAPPDVTVVDVDAHYTGTMEELEAYIEDGPAKRRFTDAIGEVTGGFGGAIKGFWPRTTSAEEQFRRPSFWHEAKDDEVELTGREEIVAAMEDLGIDKILLLGNYMITFDKMRGDDDRPRLYANAYTDYLLDKIVDPDRGIYGTVPLPYQDPTEAAELVDRVADEEGIKAICFVTSNAEPPLGNRRYDPIYAAAEDAGLPLLFHGGSMGVDHFYISGYTSRVETHHLGFLLANMAQMTSVVIQGVPEKFPELDFVFQESGLFYVPMMMYRLDAEYLRSPGVAPLLEQRPSEYMKEFYYSTQPMEYPPDTSYFEYVFEMIGGVDRLMYSSDWPHGDYDAPNVITDLPFLSRDEKARILGKNAEAVFGI